MAFPSTSVLDNFTRADENPLSGGGNWAVLSTSAPTLKLVSNRVTCSTNALNQNYWTVADFGPDCEVFATFAVVSTSAGGLRLFARVVQEGGANTFDGYCLRCSWVTGGANDTVTLNVVTNGVLTVLNTFTHEMVDGDKYGMTCIGTVLEAWCAPVATGVWGSLGTYDTVSDGTKYSAAGKIAVGMGNTTTIERLDDFGGGTYVPAATTVTGVRATATATAQPASANVSLLGVQSASTATAQPSSANVSLLGVRASATATAQPGALSGSITVAGARALSTATGQAGTLQTSANATVTGVRASATAAAQTGGFGMLSAFGGAVSVPSITITGVRAAATATAQTGGFGMLSAFVSQGVTAVTGVRATATATAQPGVTRGDRTLSGAQATATATGQAGVVYIPTPMGPGLAWMFMSGVFVGVIVPGVRSLSTATAQPGSILLTQGGAQASSAATGQPGTVLLTLTGSQATSTATARPGDFSITVTGTRATATASVPVAGTVITISGTGVDVSFAGERASATATGNAGAVLYSGLLDGAQATALATGTAGSTSTTQLIVVDGVQAMATATAQPGDSLNVIVGEQAVAFAFGNEGADTLYDFLIDGGQAMATATAQPGRRVRDSATTFTKTKVGVRTRTRYKVRVSRSAKTIART